MLMGLMVQTAEYGGGDQRELERLLAGIAGGEHEDLAQLYHRTRAAVYALALSYLKNAHDAQDVTQVPGTSIKCHACVRGCPSGAKFFDDPAFLSHRAMLEEHFTRPAQPEFYL